MCECCQLDVLKWRGRLSFLLAEWLKLLMKRGERGRVYWPSSLSLVLRVSAEKFPPVCFAEECEGCWDLDYQNSNVTAWEPGLKPWPSPLEIRNVLFTVHGRKTKPAISESLVTDIDSFYGSGSRTEKHLMLVKRVRAILSPSPPLPFPSSLSRGDCLAPSRHHLWLRVHLFRITIPPLDLWLTLTLKSHFGRNDNEFKDKSWKNTLLWQLRFPWVIDKCDRVGVINGFSFFHEERTEAAKYIGYDLRCVTKIKIGLLDS